MSSTQTAGRFLTPLQQAALRRFADQGFKGTSLGRIAADVGIKTPSIYAHFKGKDELYLSLLEPSVERELQVTDDMLAKSGEAKTLLRSFLLDIGGRFESTPHMRFLIQCAYLPPTHLIKPVARHIDDFMDRSGTLYTRAFRAVWSRRRWRPPIMESSTACRRKSCMRGKRTF